MVPLLHELKLHSNIIVFSNCQLAFRFLRNFCFYSCTSLILKFITNLRILQWKFWMASSGALASQAQSLTHFNQEEVPPMIGHYDIGQYDQLGSTDTQKMWVVLCMTRIGHNLDISKHTRTPKLVLCLCRIVLTMSCHIRVLATWMVSEAVRPLTDMMVRLVACILEDMCSSGGNLSIQMVARVYL